MPSLLMRQEFCEECEGQRRTVVRPAELADNAALPERLQRAAGDRMYSGLLQGFRVLYRPTASVFFFFEGFARGVYTK